ncbi:MAG: small multi-drug export protein [ANME-2 cluster archaeon]|nr:small multi-drug export protein [ANME-2 cluster archaeon]
MTESLSSVTVATASFLSMIPHWLSIVIIAMLPVSELRGAIPVALAPADVGGYGMSVPEAYILAVLGNMIPVIPLLLFLEPVSDFLRRWRIFDIFFTWLFTRTHHNHSESFEKYGTLALTIFVAVPLPVTGAWTGCAAAFVFGIKFRHALLAIFAGVLIAGVVVTLLTLTGISIFELL